MNVLAPCASAARFHLSPVAWSSAHAQPPMRTLDAKQTQTRITQMSFGSKCQKENRNQFLVSFRLCSFICSLSVH